MRKLTKLAFLCVGFAFMVTAVPVKNCVDSATATTLANPSPSGTKANDGHSVDETIKLINNANDIILALNDQVQKHLTANDESLTTPEPTIDMYSLPTTANEEKFSTVLQDLDSLEEQVKEAIDNFTVDKRYTHSAMLRPMLNYIQDLRSNLILLRNRLIGVAALNSIAQQVNQLTDEISDAIMAEELAAQVNKQPPLNNNNLSQKDQDDIKKTSASLGWIFE